MKKRPIMKRGDSIHLVPISDEEGVLCDTTLHTRRPPVRIQTALAQGYWEPAPDQSDGFKRRLLGFPKIAAGAALRLA